MTTVNMWGLGARLINTSLGASAAAPSTAHSSNNPGVLNGMPYSWQCLHQVSFPHSSLLGCINDYCAGQISTAPVLRSAMRASCLVGPITNHFSWKETTVIGFIYQKLTWSQWGRRWWSVSMIIVTMPTVRVPRISVYRVRHTTFYLYVRSYYR